MGIINQGTISQSSHVQSTNGSSRTLKGSIISACNALAVGFMAMFSFKKVLYVFGALAIGATLPGWAMASMLSSGILIAIITVTMYPNDPWQSLKKYFTTLRKPTSWMAHLYGHLGGLIKAFMAFAGVWVIASSLIGASAFAMLPIMITVGVLAGLTGLSQYFVEASTLIPESQQLFTIVPKRKIAPTHSRKQLIFTAVKWPLVLLHAAGQGLGFFACLLMFGSISTPLLPVVLALGAVAALIIGPSTGRYYGEPFFGWGATLYLPNSPQEMTPASEFNLFTTLSKKLQECGVSSEAITQQIKKIDQQQAQQPAQKQEQLARAFGYQVVRWTEQRPRSWSERGIQSLGFVVGFIGAGFKGALAFAGTVVFFSLCLTGTLTALLVTPPTFVLAISLVVGVATWLVQSARACPNTADSFVATFKANGYGHESNYKEKRGHEVVTHPPFAYKDANSRVVSMQDIRRMQDTRHSSDQGTGSLSLRPEISMTAFSGEGRVLGNS